MNRTQSQPYSKEWIPVLALTVVGAVLRLAGFGRLGLDHFDEGIYASVGFWSLSPAGLAGINPELIAYAPPGYPTLVGLAYRLLGPSDLAAIAVSTLAGVATIPVVGWLGRRTFGPGFGAAAAGFAAASMPHITFCRMALTDATFLLAWLVGMVLGGRFLEKPGPMRAVALGLAVGVAQLVKYNGWLVGTIVAATALLGPVAAPADHDRRRVAQTLGWGALAAAVAALTYWPWFRFVEAHGGYSALLQHQRGYLDGPSAWTRNWRLQLSQLVAIGPGMTTILGPILALFALLGLAALSKRRLHGPILGAAGLAVVALCLFRASTTWWLGAALVVFLLRDGSPSVRLVGVWWAVLSILTPLYHPYARLWLPLEAAGWLMGGLVIASVFRWAEADDAGAWRTAWLRAVAVGLATVAGWIVPGLIPPRPRTLPGGLAEPRDSLRAAAARVVALIPPEVGVVQFLGRPALSFYASRPLARRGVVNVRLPSSATLVSKGVEGWSIVDMAVLRQEGDPERALAKLLEYWEIAAVEPTTLSRATLLDIDPRATTGDLSARDEPLILLRPRRAPNSS